jgi:hypothetical protein
VLLEVAVGLPDQAPGGGEGLARLDPGPRVGGGVVDLGGERGERAVRPGGGTDPPALALHHRGDPAEEVAEVVGQVGVVAGDHALVRELAVGSERHVPEEVVAVAVDAEVLDQAGGEISVSLADRARSC